MNFWECAVCESSASVDEPLLWKVEGRVGRMSGALSKRQQARNERALQDLIKSVPGNNVCADCQARNPGMSRSLVDIWDVH